MNEMTYTVCTHCFTYNHANFIKSTLDGFTMQRTSFPVVYVIVDDCSPDDEGNVIFKYLSEYFDLTDPAVSRQEETDDYRLFYAQHLSNKNCYFVVLLLKYRHWGKKDKVQYIKEWMDNSRYHAVCEGDDYWTDENKLQKQVDFLDCHPEYVITCHRYKVYDYENEIWKSDGLDFVFDQHPDGISFNYEQNDPWLTKTLSIVYRQEAYKECSKYGVGLDVVVVFLIMKNGLGFCFNQEWGVYRLSQKGICGKQTILTNRLRAYKAIKKLYQLNPDPKLRRFYYDNYASVLFLSKGKILFQEKFEIKKIIVSLFYAFKKIVRYLKENDKTKYSMKEAINGNSFNN